MLLFVLERFRRSRGSPYSDDDHDGTLIDHAREGDLTAFNMLVERHQAIVYRVSLRYMRSPDLAEDVTQDAFLRAYNALDTFRNDKGKGFRSWLLRIATNRALDVLRASSRRPADSLDAKLDADDSAWEPEDDRESPTDHTERQALREHLQSALDKLSDDQRIVVVLYDVEGYSYDDIAEITGVAVGTVKSRLHRGRSRLREILLDHPDGMELFSGLVRHLSDADEG